MNTLIITSLIVVCISLICIFYLKFQASPFNSTLKFFDEKINMEGIYEEEMSKTNNYIRSLEKSITVLKTQLQQSRARIIELQTSYTGEEVVLAQSHSITLHFLILALFFCILFCISIFYLWKLEEMFNLLNSYNQQKMKLQQNTIRDTYDRIMSHQNSTLEYVRKNMGHLTEIRAKLRKSSEDQLEWLKIRNEKVKTLNEHLHKLEIGLEHRREKIKRNILEAKKATQEVVLKKIVSIFPLFHKAGDKIAKNYANTYSQEALLGYFQTMKKSLHSCLSRAVKMGLKPLNVGLKEISSLPLAMLLYYNSELLLQLSNLDLLPMIGDPLVLVHPNFAITNAYMEQILAQSEAEFIFQPANWLEQQVETQFNNRVILDDSYRQEFSALLNFSEHDSEIHNMNSSSHSSLT